MYGKKNMETYITICKIDSQREFNVCLRKLKLGLCINLERWDEEGVSEGRRFVYTWRRQWHPTPVPLPGKSHGRRSLVGCSPWGR